MAAMRTIWDGAHISLPYGFRPFQFRPAWFNLRLNALCQECVKAIVTNTGAFFQQSSTIVYLELINNITLIMKEEYFDKENALDCVTQTLQSIRFCLQRGLESDPKYVVELLKLRSTLNSDLNNKRTALQDIAMAKEINGTDPELWLTSCRIYRSSEQWDECFHEVIDLLHKKVIRWDTGHQHIGSALLNLAISFSKLSDVEKTMREKDVVTLQWNKNKDLLNQGLWKAIVNHLDEKKEYDALGVITIGMCDNLMKVKTSIPNFLIMNAASIPGLKYNQINIGKILFDLDGRGIKKWHLKMGEFFIKRDADVHSIAKEFKRPLLIAMTMLSLNTDTPSFLELAWNKLPRQKFDQRDGNNGTAFHFLAKQMAKKENKCHLNTAEILCRSLLSNGCSVSLKDSEGKLPHELIPKNLKIHELLKNADPLQPGVSSLPTRLDPAKSPTSWQALKELGNKRFENAEYESAMDCYQRAAEAMEKEYGNAGPPRCRAVLLGNITECFVNLKKWDVALQTAFACQRVDPTWFKAYMRLGRITQKLSGNNDTAYFHFRESLRHIMKDHNEEKFKIVILSDLLNFPVGEDQLNELWSENDDPDLWASLVYHCITEDKWDKADIAALMVRDELNKKHPVDLGCFCKVDRLAEFGVVIRDMVILFVRAGADLSSLKFHPGDTFLHAAVAIVIRGTAGTEDVVDQDYISFFHFVLDRAKPLLQDNLLDDRGNTPLHHVALLKGNDAVRKYLVTTLIDANFDVKKQNKAGKLAVDLCSSSDQVQVLLQRQMEAHLKKSSKPTAAQPSTHTSSVRPQTTWQTLKGQGNMEYQKGNYELALELYGEAEEKMEDGSNWTTHDKAVILGNMTECCLKTNKIKEAFDLTTVCLQIDPHWFKVHKRLGCLLQKMDGDNRNAFEAFMKSYSLIEEDTNEEKNRIGVLSDCLNAGLDVNQAMLLKMSTSPYPDPWATLVYQSVAVENNWNKAFISSAMIEKPVTKKFHYVDLSKFCQQDKLRHKEPSKMIVHMCLIYLGAGADVSSLKFHPGDKCLHAAISIVVLGDVHDFVEESKIFFNLVLQKVQIQSLNPADVCDEKGNTPLHHVSVLKGNNVMREYVATKLIESNCDVMKRNNYGKLAVDLCPKSDVVRNVLEREMKGYTGAFAQPMKRGFEKTQHSPSPARDKSATGRASSLSGMTKKNGSPARASQKQGQECNDCEDLIKRASDCKGRGDYASMYLNLVTVINEKRHGHDLRHTDLRKTCVDRIASVLGGKACPDIPASLLKLCMNGLKEVTKSMIEKRKWTQIPILMKSLNESKSRHYDLRFLHNLLPLKNVLFEKSLCDREDDRSGLVEFLLDNGAVFTPDLSLELVNIAMQLNEFKVVLTLLKKGGDPNGVSLDGGDTPLHAALRIALIKDQGNFDVFDWLSSQDKKVHPYADLTCVDKQGNTLLHIAARVKFSHASMMAVERLCKNRIPVNIKNKDGKLPFDFLSNRNDRRAEFLRAKPNSASAKGNKKTEVKIVPLEIHPEISQEKTHLPEQKVKTKEPPQKIFSVKKCRDEMNEVLSGLPDAMIDLFPVTTDCDQTDDSSDGNKNGDQDEEDENEESEEEDDSRLPSIDINWNDDEGQDQDKETERNETNDKDDVDDNDDDKIDAAAFVNLPWEVECTEEVWNLLKDQRKQNADDDNKNKTRRKRRKEISLSSKREVVKKIRQLADGDFSLAKQIDLEEESLQLYRVNLLKGAYMLVEIAVAFSPKLSVSGHPYSEIIRIWNVVLTQKEARQTLQKIVMSHQRGKECFVRQNLECEEELKQRQDTSSSSRYPVCYAETQMIDLTSPGSSERNQFTFCPPASTGKMEFHILKFYSFSSTMVSAIFDDVNLKVDFPFKVTPKEHGIITLPSWSPILLLGRSGTGKTTICVYRLWKKYLDYWEIAQHHKDPLLERDWPTHQAQRAIEETHGIESKEETVVVKSFDEGAEEEEKNVDTFDESLTTEQDDLVCKNEWMQAVASDDSDDDETDEDVDNDDDDDGGNNKDEEKVEIKMEDTGCGRDSKPNFINLHQVFVTKNQQLCGEVGKTFQRLRNSIGFVRDHSRFDDIPLPYTLQAVEEHAFPLFVTSRQILLLLDASLDGTPFFERDEDMALKNIIPGWGAQEEIFHNIPLEGSSDEDDIDDKNERGAVGGRDVGGPRRKHVQDFRTAGAIPKRKNDNKRECTYDVFAHEIWGKIAKEKVKTFHPSLVWTEMMSFIKGSYEALHCEKGYLDQKQYLEVGRKRAPNFCGDRREVYSIFENYLKVKREKRLFDESDLVFNIYTRFLETPYCDWVLHEIYVDELQDFTQAELTLLIALSHEPNKMFLTGDTAQSIMHGISFRFEDVKSLFYFAKVAQTQKDRSVRAIKEPEGVQELSYNYRSHAGILSLASSVLDLLTNFFRDSYDVLDRDQGLFDGPKPVLIESCSQTDLALLLSGNQRKTSHIEFGAHQAILVVSQDARDNIPNDLKSAIVLTIYESKGLEFDDILLYNFFKDSQASKVNEWRVVTEFLNDLVDSKRERDEMDNIDAELLQRPRRPHPLSFNSNQHKILNTELKHLYTALTRARVNVWIFDEDENKSAPIFEYFKVLKLVKSVGLGDQQENFGEQLFTKKSTAKEWFAKGETFMRRKLYEPAAKCFSMAEDPKMEKFANAYLLTQKAALQKQPKMYLEAGSLFVQCEKLHLAAGCFSKSKEYLLAALAFEKNGQMKEAANHYQRLSKHIDASRCLETVWMFDQAIKILVDSKLFERALDCLHRYDNCMKDCKMDDEILPQKLLIDNRPRDSNSEEHLLCKLAEDYLNKDDEDMMFKTVERLNELENRYHFLANKGYTRRAADVLEKMGKTEDAANLVFQEGYFEDGLAYAKKGKHSHLEASMHLTIARRKWAQTQMHSPDDSGTPEEDEQNDLLQECEQNVQRALELFKQGGDMNGRGEAYLVLGRLQKSKDILFKAHRNFHHVKPMNIAGQIEAFQETFMLLPSNKAFDFSDCKRHLDMVKKGIEVIKILTSPSREEADRHHAYLAFYGFDVIPGSELVSWYSSHYKMGWKRLSKKTYGDSKGKTEMEKSKVIQEISGSLSCDLTSWVSEVQQSLQLLMQHHRQSNSAILDTLDTLCLLVELDFLIQTKAAYFKMDRLDSEYPWDSVGQLLSYVPPIRWMFDFSETTKILKKIWSSKAVKSQLCRYLKYRWDNPDRVARGRSIHLTKERAKESDVLIQACFYESLFKLDDFDAERSALELETDILNLGKEWATRTRKYAIFTVVKDDTITAVESLGGRFIKSFQLLVGTKKSSPDTYEAVFKFTHLIGAFGFRGNLSVMPRLDHLLFWLEFYTSFTFCFVGKARQYPDDLVFYLPASYLHHFDIIEMCRRDQAGSLLTDVIKNSSEHKYLLDKHILDRQAFIINFLIGHAKFRFSLLNCIPDLCRGSDFELVCVERIIVLILVLLLNTGWGFVNRGMDRILHSALMRIHSMISGLSQLPERLAALISIVPTITDCKVLHTQLSGFLETFNIEPIKSCQWSDRAAPPLQKRTNETLSALDQCFSSDSSNSNIYHWDTDGQEELEEEEEQEEADEIEEYELEKEAKLRQQELEKEKRENEAATIIVKHMRHYIENRKQEKRPYRDYEEWHLFAPYGVSLKRCGICGVDFVQGAIEDGREYGADGDGQTKEMHESSQEHLSTVEEFKKFRQVYHTQIFSKLKDICIFMDSYQVKESSDIYKNITIDVQKLVTNLSNFDANLKEIMMKREWKNYPRMPATFNLVIFSFEKCRGMIERHFKEFQKQEERTYEEQHDRIAHEEAMADGFVEDPMRDFEHNPYDHPVNDFRGHQGRGIGRGGRGRGRGHDGRGRGRGHRGRGRGNRPRGNYRRRY